MKLWLKVLIGVIAVIVLAVIALPLFINANTFRPILESQLSTTLGRTVKLGDLSLSVLSGRLVAENISISDDPAYATTPFLEASSLKVGVEMRPLIFSRSLQVTSLAVIQPKIHIVHKSDGSFNFSNLGKNAASRNPAAAQKESAFPGLAVGEITIKDGVATVDSLPQDGPSLVYNRVNVSIENFSFTKQFPVVLTAGLPGGGDLSVKGNAGPINQKDASNSPFNAAVTVNHFDPVAGGFVQKDEGFSMIADIKAQVSSDGQSLTSKGTIHSDKLKLVKNGTPAPKPVNVTYEVVHNLLNRTGSVKDVYLQTGSVGAHANGGYALTPTGANLNLRLSGQSLPIDELVHLLPAMGVQLPSNAALKGGTLTLNVTVTGPATAPTIQGPVELDNTKLAGFNLGSKMSGLGALAGVKSGDATEIRQLRFNLTYTAAGIRTDNVYALVPALGQATGAGSVSSTGGLNYRLLVKPALDQGVGGIAATGLSALGGVAGNGASSAMKGGITLTITGSTSNPVFGVDMKGVAGNLLQGQANSLLNNKLPKGSANQIPVQSITGIFGKKK